MGHLAKLPNFFLAFGLISILKSDKASILIKENADKLDALIDKEFPKKSEEIQEAIVANVLLPLAKALMKEHPRDYYSLLSGEVNRTQAEMNHDNLFL